LTKRDVLSILPFNNAIVKIEITGKTLREALEHGVAMSGGEDGERADSAGFGMNLRSTRRKRRENA
jgi:2',3'-cyclic-nucleotide 2'-phosphodiesterase (5'-nucleotidase family)